jgi:hypothetical protein
LAYYNNCGDTCTLGQLKIAYDNNKFLSKEVNAIFKTAGAQSKNTVPSISSALGAVGGLNVTNFADGLARFLIKRSKEELNIAFFENLRDFLNKPEYIDLRTIFPETSRTFSVIGDEVYNFERYIHGLRESFREDLANLTTNIPKIIDNHPAFFQENPDLKSYLLGSIYVAENLRDKVHPGYILEEYPDDYLTGLDTLVHGSLQTLRLLSESLRDSTTTDSTYWISARNAKELLKDKDVRRVYVGLFYQLAKSKYDSIRFTSDLTLVEALDKVDVKNLEHIQNYVIRYVEKTDRLGRMIREYSKPANDSIALEQYYNYFKTSIDLLEYSVNAANLLKRPDLSVPLKNATATYFNIANSTADLVLDINRKNYPSAVRNAVYIYDIIKVERSQKHIDLLKSQIRDKFSKEVERIEKLLPAKEKAVREAIAKVESKADLENAKKALANAIKERDDLHVTLNSAKNILATAIEECKREEAAKTLMKKILIYGSFMADIVIAKSAEDVEKTIEAFALPTGSSRIKRETCFNVALNAYLGGFAGREQIRGLEKKPSTVYGLTAPVGISISRGHSIFFAGTGEKNWAWSTSVFISLIDIGAIASFRLEEEQEVVTQDDGEDATATIYQLPQVQLKDIISPGVFISLGIPKTPLSINAGWQVGPNLRKIKVTQKTDSDPEPITIANDYADRMYSRFSVSIVVDIPILNFYSKSRD